MLYGQEQQSSDLSPTVEQILEMFSYTSGTENNIFPSEYLLQTIYVKYAEDNFHIN